MQVGEIYYWDTDKAKGHDSRFKYHLYISECPWEDGHAFLFVNKANQTGQDFAISKNDYPFFPLDTSYVGLGGIIPYTDNELVAAAPELKGRLRNLHMQALFNAAAGCNTMTGREILLVGNALKVAFG
jgi:hypothetical protein